MSFKIVPAVKDRKGKHQLDIMLSWNKDDMIVPVEKHEQIISDFTRQGNAFSLYLYEKGGHELNVNFLKEL